METTTTPRTYMVSVLDADNSEYEAATIEECWKWINENVGLGVLYEISDPDDNIVERDRGVFDN